MNRDLSKAVVVGVTDCARCGKDHPDGGGEITFLPFVRPVVDFDGTIWTHWGECPNTGDPILLRADYIERFDLTGIGEVKNGEENSRSESY